MTQADTAPDVPVSVGEVVGAYVVDKVLGEGGMGFVALARDPQTLAKVAIKFLRPEAAANGELLARFFREAQAPNVIDHEGVAKTFLMGIHQTKTGLSLHYLVMEFVDGRTLLDELRKHGPFPVGRAISILDGAAEALAAAHAKGFTHRDIKLENIMLRWRKDQIVILDFGIAKLAEGGNAMRTRSQAVFGTSYTMSPEQCRGAGSVDHRSDIYSLACVAYAILSGRYPFPVHPPAPGQEIGHGDLTVAHMCDEPPHLSDRAPHVPRELGDFLLRCLAKDPAMRPQSMQDFCDELAHFRDISASFVFSTPSQGGVVATSIHDGARAISVPRMASAQRTPSMNGEIAPANPPRRGPLAIIVAAVGGLAVVGAIISVSWTRKAAPSSPGPPLAAIASTVEPKKIVVEVRTDPTGAQVVAADGRVLGMSPVQVGLNQGESIDVRVSLDGYKSKTLTIPSDAKSTHVDVTLEPVSVTVTPNSREAPSTDTNRPVGVKHSDKKSKSRVGNWNNSSGSHSDELPSNPFGN